MTTVTSPNGEPHTGPYATAAQTYWTAGWKGVLPLPAGQKTPVPKGYTGAQGAWPSYPDVHAWTEDHPNGNIALRLPADILGIDVDHYGDKPGGLVLTQLEQQLGALPATWRSTSRDDGHSGIRLYRIPTGLRWPGGLGPGIDTIRHDHRYTLAWPSTHPAGGTYRWITPDGATALGVVPTPDDLPGLPEAWIAHFTRGELSTDQPHAGLDTATSSAWLTQRGAGTPCNRTQHALAQALTNLTAATSRHDAALAATNRLVWLAGEGHPGAGTALQQLGAAFLAATGRDRADGEAAAEWDRMVLGAVDIAAAAHPRPATDPCTDPFAGLIPPGTRPTTPPQEQQPWTAPASPSQASLPEPSTHFNEPSAPSSDTNGSTASAGATAPDATATTTTTDLEPVEDDRTSWWPRNLDATLNDDDPEPPPAHLTRTDGHAAFYAGRVNGIIGPSESGKTWVALHAVTQALTAGQAVTYIDFEDSDRGITGRLQLLGVTRQQLRDHFAYIGPDEPFHPYLPTGIDLAEHLAQHAPDLVILDGFNAAMTLQGLDLNSNKDATTFAQQILKPLTKNDTTVVYIDHTPKDMENTSKGGIGAQAKRAMTSGCTLRVDAIKPFGKGQDGKLRIHVDKDRQGDVRGISAPNKSGHWFGDFHLTHDPATGAITASLTAPEGFDPEQPDQPTTFRPTVLMGRVSTWLQGNPGAGRNEVIDGVQGNDKHIKTALRVLVEEGWIEVAKGRNNKSLHTVVAPFSELVGPPRDQWGPSGGQVGAKPPVKTSGGGGGPDRDVVPSEPTPTQQLEGPTTSSEGHGPHPRTAERVIAGQRVNVDLDTGEVTP